MSRGIGKYQQQIMTALTDCTSPEGDWAWSIAELAEHCGGSRRQTLTACRSLESRGLVCVRSVALRMIESELGFRALKRPVPGIIVAERGRVEAEERRTAELLRGI